jgi:DNA repair exonuclease SbcCD ATPase subunit
LVLPMSDVTRILFAIEQGDPHAAGQLLPLESVIIDEGFGSLDRDGLRAAADELNRLRQHLRRIIVVSHQEELAKRFPVLYQLCQGENGTTATAVRQ